MTGSLSIAAVDEQKTIRYYFRFGDMELTHAHALATPERNPDELPEWTKLEFQQCKGCEWQGTHCPVAAGLTEPAELLSQFISYDEVDVTVVAPQRTYSKKTTVQEGLSGLFGLIMATSGCPSFKHFKGLAQYHLPFATYEETLFRVLSAYLLQCQLSGEHKSHEEVVANIQAIYDQVKNVNIGITERLRRGVVPYSDSPMNAVVILDSFGALVSFTIEEGIETLKAQFLD